MKNSEHNLSVIENFILYITHSSDQTNDYDTFTSCPSDLYQMAKDYIEEDHVDGKDNPDDAKFKIVKI